MKKTILFLSVMAAAMTVGAQVTSSITRPSKANPVTPGPHKHYCYPSTNLYFDKADGYYRYKNSPSSATWKLTRTLPGTFKPGKGPRYKLDYKGIHPWQHNRGDILKYKVHPKGQAAAMKKKAGTGRKTYPL